MGALEPVIYSGINQLQSSINSLASAGSSLSTADRLLTLLSSNKALVFSALANVGVMLDNLCQVDGLASNSTLRGLSTAASILSNSTAMSSVNSSPLASAILSNSSLSAGLSIWGGYLIGTIDTTRGNIIASDANQTGKRYYLIAAPSSTGHTSSLSWKTASTAGPTGVQTRWDGLGATTAMIAAGASTYPAANFCNGLSYPSDGGSQWYLPAMDELELYYRVSKPTTENNYTGSSSAGTFPPTAQTYGVNPSSSPNGAAYTTTSPAQTTIAAFELGGPAALPGVSGTNEYVWSSTEYSSSSAWYQDVSGSSAGVQNYLTKTNTFSVVAVRRVYF